MSGHFSDRSIACVIPFFNGSKYIATALDSVLSQTIAFAEIIVVDDGSRPEEAAFLDRLGERYPVKIIHQVNGGQGAARNRGAAEAKATFLSFLDQDDFYLQRHNEILLAGIPNGDLQFGFVYGDASLVDEDGNFTDTHAIARLNAGSQHPKTNIVNMISHDMMILPSCTLILREVFERCGGFDPQFVGYEDDDLFLRIFRTGCSNHYCDHPVTAWRNHAHRASYSIKMSRSRIAYFTKLTAMFPDVEERRLFYFRDCLVPRFVPITIAEAARAVLTDRSKADYLQLFSRMSELVCANETVGPRLKWRLRFWEHVFRDVPGSILRNAVAVLGPVVAVWSAIPVFNRILPERVKSKIAAAYRMLPAQAQFSGRPRTRSQGRAEKTHEALTDRAPPGDVAQMARSDKPGAAKSRCVYTALIGRYEQLNEQAVARESSLRFICFTDDPSLRSETWEIRQIEAAFAADPVRSHRDLKLRPHIHLPEFDQSLYIDNSVILKETPETLFEAFLARVPIALPVHDFRASVEDEFLEIAQQRLELSARVFEQLAHYRRDAPDVLLERPYWSAILLRDHRHPGVQKMSQIWMTHVLRYARRDQLSANMAFRLAGLTPMKIHIDNHDSWLHSWPHAIDRRQDIRAFAMDAEAGIDTRTDSASKSQVCPSLVPNATAHQPMSPAPG